MEFRFPLPPARYARSEYSGHRRRDFPIAFDTDIPLTPNLCGGPVIDRTGRIVGTVIACRAWGRTSVVPAAVARSVVVEQ